jgi:hypothetical protein
MRKKMNILGINMDCLPNGEVHQIQWLATDKNSRNLLKYPRISATKQ